MKNLFFLFLALIFLTGVSQAQLSGIKTIRSSGGDYATFTDAINDLNTSGVGSGGVTFNVDADYVSNENCPIITAAGTEANPIIFQKSGTGANPVVEPSTGVGITIKGGDYLTFDGIDVSAGSSSVTSGYYLVNATSTNGAQSNTIKNCTITLFRTNKSTIGIYQRATPNPSNASGANSYNVYDNIFVQNSYLGIELYGYFNNPDLSCVIKNCTVGADVANDIGNNTTITYGIYSYGSSDIEIYKNEIRNVTVTGSVKVYGLYVNFLKGTNNKIYNNTIHDIKTTHSAYSSVVTGMEVFGYPASTVEVYNNSIYGLEHGTTIPMSTTVIYGMVLSGGSQGNFYFNSVNINEDEFPSSVCFYSHPTGTGTVGLMNNVFANFSPDGSMSKYCIYISGGTTNLDYNNYYISTGVNNFVGYLSGNYQTLADWQTGTNFDTHAISADPLFTSPTYLLPLSGSPEIEAGIPISSITTDIIGITRSLTAPTIGAYEVAAGPTIWTGALNSDWGTADNWNTYAVPTLNDNATILFAGITNFPLVLAGQSGSCNNLTIENGASLTIQSNNSGTGSLITNGTVTGNMTIERYVTGSSNLEANQYHLVSIPLNSSNTSLSGIFLGSYLYEYLPSTNSWNGLNTPTTTELSENVGYMIYFPNTSNTYTFTGNPNTGMFTPSVTYEGNSSGNNFALVPNPYPSNIDWNAASGWTKTNIGASVWIYNNGNYSIWDGTNSTNGGSQYIGVGQAFFVQTTAADPILEMDNGVRTHTNAIFSKNGTTVSNQLRIHATANNMSDEALVGFAEGAQNAYDAKEDAVKFYGANEAPQLYTTVDDTKLSINNLNQLNRNVDVPLNFETDLAGEITLTFSQLESFPSDKQITFEDKLTGQLINIRQQQVYAFTHQPGNTTERFVVHFGLVAGIDNQTTKISSLWFNGNTLYLSAPHQVGQKALLEILNTTGQVLFTKNLSLDHLNTIQLNFRGPIVARVTTSDNVITAKALMMK
ncbi:MAG: right-handed parallel beta-helix repeat-containing protein [Lentimicrobium sp.]|jgi:hypothetical protein|nr:right-handed parallel beta-helix repeat-containing protein [Lentimicrobium sp.]